ncbi:unnamed protein product, partial [Phaeothamnion confervicola]
AATPVAEESAQEFHEQVDLLAWTKMMAVMVGGGVPYGQIFRLQRKHLGRWLHPVIDDCDTSILHAGQTLSECLGRYPASFAPDFVATVELGELSNLGRAFERLYEQ